MKDKKFDIQPTDNGEARMLGGINALKPSGRPSLTQMALEAANVAQPGFKKGYLEKKGVGEIKPSPPDSKGS